MKTITKVLLATLGLAAGTIGAFSAGETPAPVPANSDSPPAFAGHPRLRAMLQRRAAIRARIADRLGLTADQKSQIKATREQTRSTIQAIRSDTSLTQDQKRAKVRETLQGVREKMRSTLTPDQQQKLQQIRQHLRDLRRGPN